MMCKKYDLTNVENPADLKKLVAAYGLTYSDIAKRAGYAEGTVYYMIIRRAIFNMMEESGLDGKPYGVECIHNIQSYLRNNDITRDEFSDMCGISHNWLYGAYIEKRKEVSPSVISKILKVTGWTSDQLRSGKLYDFKTEPVEEVPNFCGFRGTQEPAVSCRS